jgi:hypothetical protein
MSFSSFIQMQGRSTAERLTTEQFRRDQFDRLPVGGLSKQVLDFGQQASLQTIGLSFSGSLNGQATHCS